MSDIVVIFKNQPPLYISLLKTNAAYIWKNLFTKNYQQKFPLYRDMKKYTIGYLEQLINQANNLCGWNFTTNISSLNDTVKLHKHIETTLANGYSNIPSEWDDLLDELHFSIHVIDKQFGSPIVSNPRKFLQLEWFNDDCVDLPDDFKFSDKVKFGDIRLQNAYVGHHPIMVYMQNDHSNISQTCRLHDKIKPGLYISTAPGMSTPFDKFSNDYYNWWHTHGLDFVANHGWEKILDYTGHPIIGQVTNLNDLEQINESPDILELQEVIVQ